MPTFNIVKKINPKKSFRVDSIKGMFDLQPENFEERFIGKIPIEKENWQIGVICGNSGTGKTIISKELFKEHYINNYVYTKDTILDDMPENLGIKEITKTFNSVGFSSPPSWLKSYSVLSEGEKMRVDLAKSLLSKKELIVFDEFTSVVDRNVAKIGSLAVAKAIRRSKKKFIAVSCHFDILDWLQPDWIFNTNNFSFSKKKEKDQKLNCQSMNAHYTFGNYLKSIII